jgi:hypothetical protein
VNKGGGGVNDHPVNLILTYSFEALLLLSREVNSLRLGYVNKDGGGLNDPTSKSNLQLLLHGANSPGPCEVNNEVDSVTLYLK